MHLYPYIRILNAQIQDKIRNLHLKYSRHLLGRKRQEYLKYLREFCNDEECALKKMTTFCFEGLPQFLNFSTTNMPEK